MQVVVVCNLEYSLSVGNSKNVSNSRIDNKYEVGSRSARTKNPEKLGERRRCIGQYHKPKHEEIEKLEDGTP